MSYQKNKNRKQQPEKKFSLGLLLPIIALLAVIPLITFMYQYDTHLSQFEWYTSYAESIDFFLYYKMVWIIVACVYMLFCMVYLFFAEEKKAIWIKNLIPLAVYCGISLISAIVSEYAYFSFHGIFEQFESVWILIGYGVIVYYTFYIMRDEAAVKRTLNWFVGGIVVMAALGLTQVFKVDFFRSSLGQNMITPSTYTGGPLSFTFELGRPYLSAYNPNYVGFYVALVIPVLVALFFATKKLWQRLGYAALIASLLFILFASQSRAGIIALAVSFLIMLICMRKVFIKNWKIGIPAIALVIVAFFVINAMNGNVLINRMKGMFQSTPEYHSLKEIQTNKDNITIVYQTQERNSQEGKLTEADSLVFHVTQDPDTNGDIFTLTDGAGTQIPYVLSEDGFTHTVQDGRFPFSFCSIRSEEFNGFSVTIDGTPWYFTNLMKEGDTTYYCRGGAGALMKLYTGKEEVPYLKDHYSLANNRGFIWNRTIPLLKKYFFLGSGPDTFIIAFPNHDLVGLYNSGHGNEIITKPHNMYLQIGVQTGVISLIALLTFFIWYFIDCLKLYWKNNYDNYLSFIGVGIFTATIGYLILGITNDSCVTVSPIFYTLIGIGLGINYKLKSEQPKVATEKISKKEVTAEHPTKEEEKEEVTSADQKDTDAKETTVAQTQNKVSSNSNSKSNSSSHSKKKGKKKKK